jgi:hypothetical protein
MAALTGNSLQKTFSAGTETRVSVPAGIGICLSAGVLIWVVDTWLRLPLHMPGWRGMITIGALVAARGLTGRPWAASAAALTSAMLGLAVGGVGPHGALVYLLPGLVIDSLTFFGPAWRRSVPAIACAAGLANAAKFVSVLAFGAGFGGVGLLWPLLSHFLFGLTGGVFAAFLVIGLRR